MNPLRQLLLLFACDNSQSGRIDTPNGFIKDGMTYYNIKDYQGNIRQVVDSLGNVVQENHYYPYGMLMAESSEIINHNRAATVSTMFAINPYLYGGKEYLTIGGANYLDFTARIYDPVTLTFGSQDQMRDDYTSIHSQLYCAANPVMYKDPSGMVLQLSGSQEDIQKVVNVYEQSFGGAMKLSVDENGIVSIASDNRITANITSSQSSCCKKMEEIINDDATTTLNIVNNSVDVAIGEVYSSTVDIGDVVNIGDDYMVTSTGALWHETVEQYEKGKINISPTDKEAYDKALGACHLKAIQFENCVNQCNYTLKRFFDYNCTNGKSTLRVIDTERFGEYYHTNIYFYQQNVYKIQQVSTKNPFSKKQYPSK